MRFRSGLRQIAGADAGKLGHLVHATNSFTALALPSAGCGPGGFLRSGALHRLVCSRSLSVWPVTGSWLRPRSEEHTSELPSIMRTSYAVLCFQKNTIDINSDNRT